MKSKSIRLTVTMLAMLAALLFSQVGTVGANQPTRQFIPASPFTLSGVCSFDVHIDFLANKEYATILVDHAGNPTAILTTGVLKVSLTNLSNGKSLDLNISGPGRSVTNPDGSATLTSWGPWLWFIAPGDLPNYSPRMFFISGQMVAQFNSDGHLTALQIIGGTTQDMCVALADP
jgi:hypothetical protein